MTDKEILIERLKRIGGELNMTDNLVTTLFNEIRTRPGEKGMLALSMYQKHGRGILYQHFSKVKGNLINPEYKPIKELDNDIIIKKVKSYDPNTEFVLAIEYQDKENETNVMVETIRFAVQIASIPTSLLLGSNKSEKKEKPKKKKDGATKSISKKKK
jgi:hypothetical protein